MPDETARTRNDENRPPDPSARREAWLVRLARRVFGCPGLAAVMRCLREKLVALEASESEGPDQRAGDTSVRAEDASQPQEEQIRYPDGRIEHPRVRYESRDVRFRWVLVVAGAAVCVGTIQFYLVWQFFFQPELRLQSQIKRSRYALPVLPQRQLPPEPRLEQLNRLEGFAMSNVYKRLAAQEKILHSFGPAPEQGFVHIPIEQAVKLLAGKLPVRKQPGPNLKNNGLVDGGESNSGRMARGELPWGE